SIAFKTKARLSECSSRLSPGRNGTAHHSMSIGKGLADTKAIVASVPLICKDKPGTKPLFICHSNR
ncbi:hypothetical protein, partial [Diaphorobacter ruginosibacter]|uniref:hypothetical protein n=1 Tax=Diaphorobacter ruginosibacter TaxID=1715720 RepID=UPI00333EE5C3